MVEDIGNYDTKDLKYSNTCRRFECGSPNMLGIHALSASLSLIEEIGVNNISSNIVDNVAYMIELLKNCSLVMTDSGGLQKEAYFFEKNCVTMRDETEWVELVNNGFNLLSGANGDLIIEHTKTMLGKSSNFSSQLYGDGHAGEQIVESLLNS
jgi:UDP-GlcNAc3NAcA epimerase